MTERFYAFSLDASACTGCKACQVACKDKNQLPLGVLWRRVYEVTGGGWTRQGEAWANTVFAYNFSISCNHCEHPKCAGVCPTDAYVVRADGIVLLDSSRCMGCRYCAWACPYGAPQYNSAAGTMTKCDFCYEELDAGLSPACVAACPLRVLDYTECQPPRTAVDAIALWEIPAEAHPYPLSSTSHTRPHLALKPHAAMGSPQEKSIANVEEVRTAGATGRGEAPLIAFTLLVQMAVGAFWMTSWLMPDFRLRAWPLLLTGLYLAGGLAASFAHLGRKRNAWRALSHLGKSWLSRELLFTLLFGAGWLATLVSAALRADIPIVSALTAALGLLLLHCMSRVYRLATVPAWNSWRTETRFFLSAALLGILGVTPLLLGMRVAAIPWTQVGAAAILLLLAQAILERSQPLSRENRSLQFELILTAMICCAAVFFLPGWLSAYSSAMLLLIVLAEQAAARWSFYEARR